MFKIFIYLQHFGINWIEYAPTIDQQKGIKNDLDCAWNRIICRRVYWDFDHVPLPDFCRGR